MPDWWAEPDWLSSENPHHLASLMETWRASNRKFRLAAAACCRQAWPRLRPAARSVVEAAERFADGEGKFAEVRMAADRAREDGGNPRPSEPAAAVLGAAHREARLGIDVALYGLLGIAWGGPALPTPRDPGFWEEGSRTFCQIIWDVFGNPSRPPAAPDPGWLAWDGGMVKQLAQAAYEERLLPSGLLSTARLAVLADALEEAGCTDAALLDHLRSPGPHVRGCWAVDLVLGKE